MYIIFIYWQFKVKPSHRVKSGVGVFVGLCGEGLATVSTKPSGPLPTCWSGHGLRTNALTQVSFHQIHTIVAHKPEKAHKQLSVA